MIDRTAVLITHYEFFRRDNVKKKRKRTHKHNTANKPNTPKKQPKTFKWYLDKVLMVPVGAMALFGALSLLAGRDDEDAELMLFGVAIMVFAGLLASPNIVLYGIKDSRGWEKKAFEDKKGRSFEEKLYKETSFYRINDPSPYHEKVRFGVTREAVLNFGALFILIAYLLIRPVIAFLFGLPRSRAKGFALIAVVLTCLIPSFVYNVTCSVYRILAFRRREYFACHAVVKSVDNFEMCISGKYGVYEFKYCRCLGIREKDVHDTEAVLVFVPGEVYLIPVSEKNA